MRCERCGAYASGKNNFCIRCGAKLNHSGKRKRVRNVPKWMVCLIVTGAVLGIAFFEKADIKDSQSRAAIETAIKRSYQSEPIDATDEVFAPAQIERIITDAVAISVIDQRDTQLTLEITVPNMYELYSSVSLPADTPQNDPAVLEQVEEYIREALKNGDYSMVTNTVTVDTQKVDGEIEIIPNFAYVDAIYGNMLSYYTEITNP